jgi:hypothetical protein
MADTLTVALSEVSLEGKNAEFTVDLDGVQIGGPSFVTIGHGASEPFTYSGDFGPGPHTVAVNFINNDNPNGSSDFNDLNLYVESITFDNQLYAGEYAQNNAMNGGKDLYPTAAEMYANGTATFSNVIGTPGEPPVDWYGAEQPTRVVTGSASDDIIRTNGGSESGGLVNGGFGNDIIVTGTGNDTLTGGSGRDTFIEIPNLGNDTIHFEVGSGGDILNVAGFGFTGFDDVLAHMTVLAQGGTLLTYPDGETTTFVNDNSQALDQIVPANFVANNFRFEYSDPPPPPANLNLTIHASEDAFEGDARFFVVIDGYQTSGVHTVTASHALGQVQDIVLPEALTDGPHTVQIYFNNDSYGGSPDMDRNLYIEGVTFNGVTYSGENAQNGASNNQPDADPNAAEMYVSGAPVTFNTLATPQPSGEGQHTISVFLAEDAFQGDAQFTLSVDGDEVFGPTAVTTKHGDGFQEFTFTGTLPNDPHDIAVNFINDAYGGSPDADRNLYVGSIKFDGFTMQGSQAENSAANGNEAADPSAAVMDVDGTATFTDITVNGAPQNPPISTIVLHLSEDAFQGDAQFVVSIDHVQQGSTRTVTALHNQGQVQDVTLTGDFGPNGPDTVAISFINDTWGGTPDTDRNLYVQSIDVNGVHFQGNTADNNAANGGEASDPSAAVMDINGTAEFNVNHTAPPPEIMG